MKNVWGMTGKRAMQRDIWYGVRMWGCVDVWMWMWPGDGGPPPRIRAREPGSGKRMWGLVGWMPTALMTNKTHHTHAHTAKKWNAIVIRIKLAFKTRLII